MRHAAAILLLALPAAALPPLSPGFARLKELRRQIDVRAAELREQEAFDRKPREERMLLTFRKEGEFEGKALSARQVVEACLRWDEVDRPEPTEAGRRVLELLPFVLEERRGGKDAKERRQASIPLLKALESDAQPVREAAIAAIRRLYNPPRVDRYDPAHSAKDRAAAVRAWKRTVAEQNW
ncbi:MAG: hypothetical protein L6Q95_18775 [Planctomycetes bacterium]|nr:hypothetical protein [Planctomycetota bacterium]